VLPQGNVCHFDYSTPKVRISAWAGAYDEAVGLVAVCVTAASFGAKL